jgi:hypothetical protein
VSAFGALVTCNLCEAEGKRFVIPAEGPFWMQKIEDHTRVHHEEHQAALARGEEYVPVNPSPMGG